MTDILETHRAEQTEAIKLLRAAFPDISITDAVADSAARELRDGWIYRKGRWPDENEVRAYWKGREQQLEIAKPTTSALIAAE
jgi:hypothetical protein